ncbi:MAG: dihydrolipoyl dehydrogenase [Limnochordia bacterium]|jgi:dihydrolipoamide dehydrogenase
MQYDLCIIGGGPGGYVAAIRAAQRGKSVCLIEQDEVGGTCLNRGCIPTKALTSSVELLAKIRKARTYGIQVGGVEVDFTQMMKRKDQTVARLVKGINFLLQKNKVELIKGTGRISGPGRIVVNDQEIKAEDIIIATGARPVVFPQFKHDGQQVITSDEALTLQSIPGELIIIGGGVIGSEFASIFATLGSKVKIVEMLPRVLPMADADVSAQLETAFKKMGVEIYTGQKVVGVEKGAQVRVQLESGDELTGDVMLVSIGRGVNTEGLGLDTVGVALNQKGEIQVDARMATTDPGIWAIGDVTDCALKLAHVASAQGLVAVDNIMGENRSMDYGAIPNCVFTQPEIAWVGLTEAEAQEAGYSYKTAKFPFMASGKALAMGDYDGFVKIIAAIDGELLGLHIIGPHASDLIAEPTLALSVGLDVEEFVTAVRAHPTLPEALMEAGEAVLDRPIHC